MRTSAPRGVHRFGFKHRIPNVGSPPRPVSPPVDNPSPPWSVATRSRSSDSPEANRVWVRSGSRIGKEFTKTRTFVWEQPSGHQAPWVGVDGASRAGGPIQVDPQPQPSSHPGFMDAARAQTGVEDRGSPPQRVHAGIQRPHEESSEPGFVCLPSDVQVDLPWDYTLSAMSVRILADILVATMQSRDRPSEVA